MLRLERLNPRRPYPAFRLGSTLLGETRWANKIALTLALRGCPKGLRHVFCPRSDQSAPRRSSFRKLRADIRPQSAITGIRIRLQEGKLS
jgi:hypothetical protein